MLRFVSWTVPGIGLGSYPAPRSSLWAGHMHSSEVSTLFLGVVLDSISQLVPQFTLGLWGNLQIFLCHLQTCGKLISLSKNLSCLDVTVFLQGIFVGFLSWAVVRKHVSSSFRLVLVLQGTLVFLPLDLHWKRGHKYHKYSSFLYLFSQCALYDYLRFLSPDIVGI